MLQMQIFKFVPQNDKQTLEQYRGEDISACVQATNTYMLMTFSLPFVQIFHLIMADTAVIELIILGGT